MCRHCGFRLAPAPPTGDGARLVREARLGAWPRAVDVAPAGPFRLAVAVEDDSHAESILLLEQSSFPEATRIESDLESVWDVRFSGDGKLLAWLDSEELAVWDVLASRPVAHLEEPCSVGYEGDDDEALGPNCLALAYDGLIAVGYGRGQVWSWRSDGRRGLDFPPMPDIGPVCCLRFTDNGRLLCGVAEAPWDPDEVEDPPQAGRVQIWDAATRDVLHCFDVDFGRPYAFSPDGRLLFGTRVHDDNRTPTGLVAVEVARGAITAELGLDRPLAVTALACTGGEARVWTGEFFGDLNEWQLPVVTTAPEP